LPPRGRKLRPLVDKHFLKNVNKFYSAKKLHSLIEEKISFIKDGKNGRRINAPGCNSKHILNHVKLQRVRILRGVFSYVFWETS
jgi:hypothetical protein